jgi:hypothetical protein
MSQEMSWMASAVRRNIDGINYLIIINRKTNMNTQTKSPEYMLIFRGTDWHKGLSPEQMQQIASQWMAWFQGLTAQGKAIAGNPLAPEGKLVSGKNGRVVADGPFAESKEAIGGYFLLRVGTLDEAVAIAKDCPGLAYGMSSPERTGRGSGTRARLITSTFSEPARGRVTPTPPRAETFETIVIRRGKQATTSSH